MPGKGVENEMISTRAELRRNFTEILSDFSQYLSYQKSLGVSHVRMKDDGTATIAAWGTPQWKQHRFMGQGPTDAKIMIVDSTGDFFQNKAGRLLVKILKAMHLTPEEVFICNAADLAEITSRVRANPPKVIITLGAKAAALLLDAVSSPDGVLGTFQTFCGVKVMPTRHPEELLQDAALKREVWESMQKVMAEAGLGHGG